MYVYMTPKQKSRQCRELQVFLFMPCIYLYLAICLILGAAGQVEISFGNCKCLNAVLTGYLIYCFYWYISMCARGTVRVTVCTVCLQCRRVLVLTYHLQNALCVCSTSVFWYSLITYSMKCVPAGPACSGAHVLLTECTVFLQCQRVLVLTYHLQYEMCACSASVFWWSRITYRMHCVSAVPVCSGAHVSLTVGNVFLQCRRVLVLTFHLQYELYACSTSVFWCSLITYSTNCMPVVPACSGAHVSLTECTVCLQCQCVLVLTYHLQYEMCACNASVFWYSLIWGQPLTEYKNVIFYTRQNICVT